MFCDFVLPHVQVCSTVFKLLQADLLLIFYVMFLKKELYMLYFLLRYGLRTKFQSPGGGETPRNSVVIIYLKKSKF